MGVNNFPVDLVLLGMVAGFLVLRLRSVLGKRTGYEGQPGIGPRPARPAGRVIDSKAEPTPETGTAMPRQLPPRESPAGQALSRLQSVETSFSPGKFLDSAEHAFRLIVMAFAKGDRAALGPLLTAPLLQIFDQAITEREQANQTQHMTLHSIRSATIETAEVAADHATITVRFVSDQVSYTNNAANETLSGTEAVTEITDLWTFDRQLGTRDPSWRLAAAQNG